MTILPGGTLGMLGGGQLGRMFTVAARTMGYNVIVLDPDPDSPAGKLATDHICADYTDTSALEYLANTCQAISTEFENVPASSLEWLTRRCIVRPGARAVAITQDRIHEKTFLREHGFSTAPFYIIYKQSELAAALAQLNMPAILKVSRFGYDGKGQVVVRDTAQADNAFASLKNEACVLEAFLPLQTEVSVVVARGEDGQMSTYPVAENIHKNGILDFSIIPARIHPDIEQQARAIACSLAQKLEYIGVMAVEFFVLKDNQLLVNEIAPRPHNSGHYSLDACVTHQFEQQVRVLCGLPLGDTRLLSPVVMANLLGDLWHNNHPPAWENLLKYPNVKLHLYGKVVARPGRKMGHFNVLAEDTTAAYTVAQCIKQELVISQLDSTAAITSAQS
ncbi:MAG: 5-(carboxyamino)imidazole ribonucleotide synthase [Gammaproteobacteria bacterium]|nr:5-(carboxyamino)imidazole ribonucleotide synthase [Gammaproteobacteria bacterium]